MKTKLKAKIISAVLSAAMLVGVLPANFQIQANTGGEPTIYVNGIGGTLSTANGSPYLAMYCGDVGYDLPNPEDPFTFDGDVTDPALKLILAYNPKDITPQQFTDFFGTDPFALQDLVWARAEAMQTGMTDADVAANANFSPAVRAAYAKVMSAIAPENQPPVLEMSAPMLLSSDSTGDKYTFDVTRKNAALPYITVSGAENVTITQTIGGVAQTIANGERLLDDSTVTVTVSNPTATAASVASVSLTAMRFTPASADAYLYKDQAHPNVQSVLCAANVSWGTLTANANLAVPIGQFGGFVIHKTDVDTGAPLAGVKFMVYAPDAVTPYAPLAPNYFITTDANGYAGVSGIQLPGGTPVTLYVEETATPPGYAPDNTVYPVQVTLDAQRLFAAPSTTVPLAAAVTAPDAATSDALLGNGLTDITNKSMGAAIVLRKLDSVNTATYLSGAVYKVYADSACTEPSLGSFTTGTYGYGGMVGLNDGQIYYVKEVTAPATYNIDTTPYSVTASKAAAMLFPSANISVPTGVTLNGSISTSLNTSTLAGAYIETKDVPLNATVTALQVVKTNTTGTPIVGISFRLVDASRQPVAYCIAPGANSSAATTALVTTGANGYFCVYQPTDKKWPSPLYVMEDNASAEAAGMIWNPEPQPVKTLTAAGYGNSAGTASLPVGNVGEFYNAVAATLSNFSLYRSAPTFTYGAGITGKINMSGQWNNYVRNMPANTKIGAVLLTKYNANNTSAYLSGAGFSIYPSMNDYNTSADHANSIIGTFTTDSTNPVVCILYRYDAAAPTPPAIILKETQFPTGYQSNGWLYINMMLDPNLATAIMAKYNLQPPSGNDFYSVNYMPASVLSDVTLPISAQTIPPVTAVAGKNLIKVDNPPLGPGGGGTVWAYGTFALTKTQTGSEPDAVYVGRAVYAVYRDLACTLPLVNSSGEVTIETSPSAKIVTLTVPWDSAGAVPTYYIKEKTAPTGYLPDETVYSVKPSEFTRLAFGLPTINPANGAVVTYVSDLPPQAVADQMTTNGSLLQLHDDIDESVIASVYPYTSFVAVKKADGDSLNGKAIEGIAFQLVDQNGNPVYYCTTPFGTATTTAPQVSSADTPMLFFAGPGGWTGDLYLKEDAASAEAKGYYPASNLIPVTQVRLSGSGSSHFGVLNGARLAASLTTPVGALLSPTNDFSYWENLGTGSDVTYPWRYVEGVGRSGDLYAEGTVSLRPDGGTSVLTVVSNKPIPSGGFGIRKVDVGTSVPRAGAVFGVYSDSGCTTQLMNGGTPVTMTTNADGYAAMCGVPLPASMAETVWVKELTPPVGYGITGTGIYSVTATPNGYKLIEGGLANDSPYRIADPSQVIAPTTALEQTMRTEGSLLTVKDTALPGTVPTREAAFISAQKVNIYGSGVGGLQFSLVNGSGAAVGMPLLPAAKPTPIRV